jgi:hypothetical protein
MKFFETWAEEHWDVLAMTAMFGLAVTASLALSIAYNVAAARFEPVIPAAPTVELGSQAPAAVLEPAPLPRLVPYS